MNSSSRVVRSYAFQWFVLAVLALAFIGARLAIGIDDAMNWSLCGQLLLFTTLACLLGVIYRRPLPDDRS
ncbi:hypothetical protein [Aeromicrobium sp. Leaf350]|uniref:hypothetical protein n=1 Tax=Aeromicrobium sp. Leaf350 TaxID=2876565 RepID=UPI001E5AD345|nr:hypothetical protein [Aeromicrobium sp. Leaf350]